MLCCLRLEKDEANGYEYVDMTGRPEYQDLAAKRASRSSLAKAALEGDISSVRTEITTPNSEQFDVIVVGRPDDLSDIGSRWRVETNMALGMAYEHIAAWMTIRDDRPLFIIRDVAEPGSEDKAAKRLERFLQPAIEYLRSQEIAA